MGDTDDWVDKAEEERLGIIAKYDKGREEGADIEPWDDPAFEIYHVTDHYGFIHDQRFPLKFNPEENKFRALEAERADKWVKMHANWDKYKNSEKLRKRTFKGVPNKVRGLFWGLFLDLPTIKEQQKGKYDEMYQLARKHSLDVRQIDLDVNRTYRDHVMFRERYGVKQRSLFNILCAYSIYNSEVGYCQGMSQVAALMLTYMDEEDAFWGLSQLMSQNKYGMHGFFIAGFPKLVRFQQHHDKTLKAMIPKLKKHFDKHGVDVGLYTLKWFFQCFLDRVPFELALRLWDIFLMDGDKVLICGAYTILKLHQKQLLQKKSMDDILDYLQSRIPSDVTVNNDKIIEAYQRNLEELHRKKLDTGGEPTEEELPKKPFGLIENIVKPIPVRQEQRISTKVAPQPSPTKEGTIRSDSECGEEEDEEASERASATRVTTSVASSSVANSPRHFSRPLSSISNFSYTSAIEEYHSSKSPLKMNGIGPAKSSTGHSETSPGAGEKMKENSTADTMENGSVDSLASIDTLEPQFGEQFNNAIPISVEIHSRNGDELTTFQAKGQKMPPPPPARSPHSTGNVYSTTISVTATPNKSHNNNGELHTASNARTPRKSPLVEAKVSPASDLSASRSPTSSIPTGGEAVRIHVPYSNSHEISPIPVKSPTTTTKNNFDTLKNDPNRIKIDISSK